MNSISLSMSFTISGALQRISDDLESLALDSRISGSDPAIVRVREMISGYAEEVGSLATSTGDLETSSDSRSAVSSVSIALGFVRGAFVELEENSGDLSREKFLSQAWMASSYVEAALALFESNGGTGSVFA